MDPAERLADYLAGELDADEASALEADLARDPRLRAQYTALQRADAALASLESPVAASGFEDRLRAAIDVELTRQLGEQAAEPVRDQLAERRARRGWSRMPALAGAAAAAVLLVGVALVAGLPGTDGVDDTAGVAMDMDDGAEMESLDAPGEEAPQAMAVPEGPLVVGGDRELSAADAEDLLFADPVMVVASLGFTPAEGERTAQRWRGAVEADEVPASDDADDPVEEAEDGDAAVATGPVGERQLITDGPVDDADLEAIDRCLAELAAGGQEAIPAYAELVIFDGEPAFAFGMVGPDPATGTFSRPEVWVVARSDCQVLHFVQG